MKFLGIKRMVREVTAFGRGNAPGFIKPVPTG
jgi:hypothetical protein